MFWLWSALKSQNNFSVNLIYNLDDTEKISLVVDDKRQLNDKISVNIINYVIISYLIA